MKLLVVASSLDLRAPHSSTPAWWQLLKALAEEGVELVVAPYQGPAIESPWWTAAANPCELEGDVVGWLKRHAPTSRTAPASADESVADRLTLAVVERLTRPRWRSHLARLIDQHRGFDAVLFLTIPANHFGGIPTLINRRFGVPTYLYDGDVPASLPRFAGFRTGFKMYQGADLSEYAGVFSSSKGGMADLARLGARDVRVLYYAADPARFSPRPVEQDIDVFFYGHGAEYREAWLAAMLDAPSHELPDARFAVRGTRLGVMPLVAPLPYASFSKLNEYCSRSRINLLITRQAHASVYASSTSRPFELAAMGCAMVSNPYLGIEEWFEPNREVVVVRDASHVVDAYRDLLSSAALRQELAARARARLLAEHTYQHRARQLIEMLTRGQGSSPEAVSVEPVSA